MKFLLGFLFLLSSPIICLANAKWQQITILDVIQLINYESKKYHKAITVEGFDLPLIIDRSLEECSELVAGNAIVMRSHIIPDPFVENPKLRKITAIQGCGKIDK